MSYLACLYLHLRDEIGHSCIVKKCQGWQKFNMGFASKDKMDVIKIYYFDVNWFILYANIENLTSENTAMFPPLIRLTYIGQIIVQNTRVVLMIFAAYNVDSFC